MAGVLNNYGISNVQQKLKDFGYDPGPVDNLWGPRTEAAVRKYQQANNLTVDGIVGEQTWGALTKPKPTAPTPVKYTIPTGEGFTAQPTAQPTASSSPYPGSYIKQGNSGSNVSQVQQALKNAGYSVGSIDGIFGPQTAAAVKKFQQDKGLAVDAIVGPQTWGALNQPKPQPAVPATAQPTQPATPVPQPQNPAAPQDPMLAIIGNDPEAMAMYNQAKLAAQQGSRNAMETLNARGILNSTITADRVAQTEQEAMTGANVNIMGLLEQRKQQKIQEAYNRLNLLGYADNEVAKVLGVAVGTPTAAVKQQEAQMQMERDRMAASERQAAQSAAQSAARASASAAAPKAPSAAQSKAENAGAAYQWVNDLADRGKTADEVLSLMYQNSGQFTADGISLADLKAYILELFSHRGTQKIGNLANMGLPGGKKPWQI